jgi:hypothetical protein
MEDNDIQAFLLALRDIADAQAETIQKKWKSNP